MWKSGEPLLSNLYCTFSARAHDPEKRQLKLPPGAALVTGNQHVKSVALKFVDGILDPNLARYVQKDRSRSTTPPGSPWEETETEMTAADNAAANNTGGIAVDLRMKSFTWTSPKRDVIYSLRVIF